MANPSAVHEPSMEEILASIRQIISEDGSSSAPKIDGVVASSSGGVRASAAESAAYESAPQSAEKEHGEPAQEFETEPDFAMHMHEAAPEEPVDEPDYAPEPLRAPLIAPRIMRREEDADEDEEALLSPRTGDAVSGAFGALAHSLLTHNTTRTLEDVVAEMLQPMLKQWLDDNLPAIVERKVQEEIERVSRGRR